MLPPFHTDTLRSPAQFRAPLPLGGGSYRRRDPVLDHDNSASVGPAAGLTVPAIAAAAVFLYTWRTLRRRFSRLPSDLTAARGRLSDISAHGMWWIPVCLSLFPVSVLLPMFAFTQPPVGQWILRGALRILYCWRIYRDPAIVPMGTYVTHPSEIDDAVNFGGLPGSFYAQRLTEPILLARRSRNPLDRLGCSILRPSYAGRFWA